MGSITYRDDSRSSLSLKFLQRGMFGDYGMQDRLREGEVPVRISLSSVRNVS